MTQEKRTFTVDDLNPVEPATERIRRSPSRYLGSRLPTSPFMASALVQDALLCGITEIRVAQHDNWTSVSANEDWIIPHIKWERPLNYDHVFRTLIPFPQAGPNSFRSEVVVAAFSTDLSVLLGAAMCTCVGTAPPDSVLEKLGPMPFVVVFKIGRQD
jgi:hypothetical protein